MLPSALQNIIGPCLSEIPIRTSITPTASLFETAEQLHHQFIEDSPHEGLGMDDIIRQCAHWSASGDVVDFGWRTAFQQGEEDADRFEFLGQPSRVTAYERRLLPRTRPELYATPKGETLVLSFEGNRRLISEETAGVILRGLRDILADL